MKVTEKVFPLPSCQVGQQAEVTEPEITVPTKKHLSFIQNATAYVEETIILV